MRHVLGVATVTFAALTLAGTISRPADAAGANSNTHPVLIAANDSNGQNLLSLFQQIQQLQQQVRDLQGQVDTLRYQIKQDDQGQRDLYQNLDQRLSALENGNGGAGRGQPVNNAPGGGNNAGAGGGMNNAQGGYSSTGGIDPAAQSAYTDSFNKLENGKYDAAISAFKSFVSQYPDTALTGKAWYWLGEAYYVKQNFSGATNAFETVVNRFNNSPKVPNALYKIGLIQAGQGQDDNAVGTLHRITQQYPNSNAANLAQQKLQSMGQ